MSEAVQILLAAVGLGLFLGTVIIAVILWCERRERAAGEASDKKPADAGEAEA